MSAFSISVFPKSFFRYFSDHESAEAKQLHRCPQLTFSSLFYLLCRDTKDVQYFHHYLHDDVRLGSAWSNLCISLQALEKVLDPFKDVDQGILRCNNILSRLTDLRVKLTQVAKRREDTDMEEDASTRENHFCG
jgi:hypothetical protein